MIILQTLLFSWFSSAATIAVYDTQFDLTHPAYHHLLWTNSGEVVGDGEDNDSNGYNDDVYGWNFIDDNNILFEEDTDIYNELDLKYLEISERKRAGVASQQELDWHKEHKHLEDRYYSYISFIHGTGVAHAAIQDAKVSKVMLLRNSGREEFFWDDKEKPPIRPVVPEELQEVLDKVYDEFYGAFKESLNYAASHGVRVFNWSFSFNLGEGENAGAWLKQYIRDIKGFVIPREQAAEFDKEIYDRVFIEIEALFKLHPNILFTFAAGNRGRDIDALDSLPQRVPAENTIVVGAAHDLSGLAKFSNYGVNTVDILIPSVNDYTAVPGGKYAMSSATSVSAPRMANVAMLMLEENDKLTTQELIEIINSTAKKVEALREKVKTGSIVRKELAVNAARYTQFMSVAEAIEATLKNHELVDVSTFLLKEIGLCNKNPGDLNTTSKAL